jgi:hypothetical protein
VIRQVVLAAELARGDAVLAFDELEQDGEQLPVGLLCAVQARALQDGELVSVQSSHLDQDLRP